MPAADDDASARNIGNRNQLWALYNLESFVEGDREELISTLRKEELNQRLESLDV